MRHMTAARKGANGGWHYVCLGRDGGYALGNCQSHEPHATEAEARQCYTDWRRERLSFRKTDNWSNCFAGRMDDPRTRCPNPADNVAEIRGEYMSRIALLCDEHASAEFAVPLLGLDAPAGDAWVS